MWKASDKPPEDLLRCRKVFILQVHENELRYRKHFVGRSNLLSCHRFPSETACLFPASDISSWLPPEFFLPLGGEFGGILALLISSYVNIRGP